MEKPFSLSLFLVLLALSKAEDSPPNKRMLIMSHVFHRHGNRTPYYTYPNSKSELTKSQLGVLTKEGRQSAYELGTFLREYYMKYPEFFDGKYVSENLYVQSSTSERCMMTSSTVMAALFPPEEDQKFNKSLYWQPIPTYSIPREDDLLLRTFADCPSRKACLEETFQSEEWVEFEKKHESFLEFFAEKTGAEKKLTRVWDVYDQLEIEELQGKKLPEWYNASVKSTMYEITMFVALSAYGKTDIDHVSVYGGYALWLINDHMRSYIDHYGYKKHPPKTYPVEDSDGNPLKKLYVFSTHETVLYSLAAALEVKLDQKIPFTAAFIINLYKEVNGQFNVEVDYRGPHPHIQRVHLKRCGSFRITQCNYSAFDRSYEAYFVRDMIQQCYVNKCRIIPNAISEPMTVWTCISQLEKLNYSAICVTVVAIITNLALFSFLIYKIRRNIKARPKI